MTTLTTGGVEAFVAESNRIEGITRPPTPEEVNALEQFLTTEPTQFRLTRLVSVFQPGAVLRDKPELGYHFEVGNHRPPPGGPHIRQALDEVLTTATTGRHPYLVHCAYETLHPYTDGNGRSGRALWLWGMQQHSEIGYYYALMRGFLHTFYYQALEFHDLAH